MFVGSLLILLFIFDVALIVLIFTYNPKGTANRFLGLLLIPITLSNLVILFLYSAQGKLPVKIGTNIAIWNIILFFPLFYHFTFNFPRKQLLGKKKYQMLIVYLTPIIIGLLNLLSIEFDTKIGFFSSILPFSLGAEKGTGFYLYHFFVLFYILILLVLTSRRLILSLRLPILRRERHTVILLLIGFIPLSFVLLFNYLLFYPLSWGIYLYLSASTVYTVFFVFLVIQFGFIERKALVRVFILYPALIGVLFLIFRVFLTDFNSTVIELFKINGSFLMSVEVLVFFALLSPLTKLVEDNMVNIIIPIKQNFHEALKDGSAKLVHIINLYELDKFLSELFFEEIRIKQFFFLVKDDHNRRFQTLSRKTHRRVPEFSERGELIDKLKKEKRIIDIQQLAISWSKGEELNILDYFKISLVIPLFEQNNIIGIALLGEPGFVQTWHQPEIEALQLFASGLSITMVRCKMHRRALELEKRQARIEKMTVLNELTSGVAHEIRNPMSIISTSAETIAKKELSSQEIKRLALYIQEETKRMSDLLSKILVSFSPKNDLKNTSTAVVSVVRHTFELIEAQARKKNIHLEISAPIKNIEAFIDWAALTQVCLNIALNAIEATPENGTIEAKLEEQKNKIRILFINDGVRIPESIRDQVFNPFFTTKEKGTGLGLSVSRRLIKEAGGSLKIVPHESKTVFQILLPTITNKKTNEKKEPSFLRKPFKNILS